MLKEMVIGVLSLIVVVLVVISFTLYDSSNELKQEYDTLQVFQNTLKLNYDLLEDNCDQLKRENSELKENMSALNVKMQEIVVEIDKAVDQLNDFETTVRVSMDWFKNNNNINNFGKYAEIKEELKNQCLELAENSCQINLKCIAEVNENNDFMYRTDIEWTAKEDFLQSLGSIYKNKGGDCEDFSLLFTAEYNYLVNECNRNNSRTVNISSHVSEELISGDYMYPVCGTFDPEGVLENLGGHCVVAMVNKPIINTSDLYNNLKDAVLVEPQIGEIILNLNETNLISLFKKGQAPNTLYYLSIIITEDDLKLFYEWSEEVEWKGYTDFLDYIQPLKEKIGGFN